MVTMNNMLNCTFGEASSEISATFKKTVLIRQYETEVIELHTVLKIEKPLSGAERVFISAILQAQLEYVAYCQLLIKGIVTKSEFDMRKSSLEEGVTCIKDKAESVLGKSLDEYLDTKIDAQV